MLLKCCPQYVSQFGKLSSGHRTGKAQYSFQFQRRAMPKMLKVSFNYTHFICQEGHAQSFPSKALAIHELRTLRYTIWLQKRQRNWRSNCQHLSYHRETREFQKIIYFCFIDYVKDFDCVDHKKLKNLKEMGIPDHHTCLLGNLYESVRSGHGTTGQFKTGKGECQG